MSILSFITDSPVFAYVKWGLIAALAVGLFWFGYHTASTQDQVKLDKYIQTKQKDADQLSQINLQTNDRIVLQYITQTKTITKVVHDQMQAIANVPDPNTMLSNAWIGVFNASTLEDPDFNLNGVKDDAGSSGIGVMDVLPVIIMNNATCAKNAQQLIDLQTWILTEQAAVDKVNKKNKVKP